MARLYARLGLLIGIGFGALWANWAAQLLALGRIGLAVVAVPALALAAAALLRPLARPPGAATGPRRTWLYYLLVVVGEIALLNLLFWLIERQGWQLYRLPAIGLVIGLHFFPLARAVRFPGFRLLGAVMVGAALAAIAAIALGADPRRAAGLDCLANALLLWGSVALALIPRRS
jgi:hypothetical protein